MLQIEDGKLYLDTEEYEDYGDDYWDREWIIEYYDNQQIGDKIMFMISCNSSLVSSANFRFIFFSSSQGLQVFFFYYCQHNIYLYISTVSIISHGRLSSTHNTPEDVTLLSQLSILFICSAVFKTFN